MTRVQDVVTFSPETPKKISRTSDHIKAIKLHITPNKMRGDESETLSAKSKRVTI